MMIKFKKVVLMTENKNDYLLYLMRIMANNIKKENNCELEEININNYEGKYGIIKEPCILLIKNNKIKNIINGFKYYSKLPKF